MAEGIWGRWRRLGEPVGVAVAERDVILGTIPPYIPPRGILQQRSSILSSIHPGLNTHKKREVNLSSDGERLRRPGSETRRGLLSLSWKIPLETKRKKNPHHVDQWDSCNGNPTFRVDRWDSDPVGHGRRSPPERRNENEAWNGPGWVRPGVLRGTCRPRPQWCLTGSGSGGDPHSRYPAADWSYSPCCSRKLRRSGRPWNGGTEGGEALLLRLVHHLLHLRLLRSRRPHHRDPRGPAPSRRVGTKWMAGRGGPRSPRAKWRTLTCAIRPVSVGHKQNPLKGRPPAGHIVQRHLRGSEGIPRGT